MRLTDARAQASRSRARSESRQTFWKHGVVTHRRGEHDFGMIIGPGNLLRAGRIVDVQRLGPRAPAVGRAIDAARFTLLVDRALRREQHQVGVLRVDEYRRDLLRILEAEMLPRP